MSHVHFLRRSARRYAIGDFPGQAVHPTATAWAAQVIVNGGAAVSNTSLLAVSGLCYDFDTAAITSLIVAACIFAPDNLIASITPFIFNSGNTLWTNHNFVLADLTVNGLLGNGSTKYLDTGCNPTTIWANQLEGGLSVYTPQGAGSAASVAIGVADSGFNNSFNITEEQSSNTYFECWSATAGAGTGYVTYASSGFLGFIHGSRTSASAGAVYKANSTTAWAAQASFSGTGGTRPNGNIYCFCNDTLGIGPSNFSAFRTSYACIHHGMTSSQGQSEFNAVDKCRRALGGGFV